MSAESTISSDNLRTIVVVGFIIGLLSLAFNFFNYARINNALDITAQLQAVDATNHDLLNTKITDVSGLTTRVDALEKRLTADEAAMATPGVAEAPNK